MKKGILLPFLLFVLSIIPKKKPGAFFAVFRLKKGRKI
jgi:hypothetical protein